ncbi:MAG: PilZ domain-containing protein [Treponema sp.]|jgi:hypothetical protein|nr:PilZ domain-containing protein [Treponema sp.]
MGILTSQKITTYYERYKVINVTFTKEIIQVTGMITQQVYLKCGGDFWPCVVYSSSFEGAKIVANIQSGLLGKLQQANNAVSLRLCFKNPDSGSPLTFFVAARSMGYVPYSSSKGMAIFTLQFTQRPPDDLIEIMGRLLDANVNSAKRREERIPLTPETIRKLKVLPKECAVFIERVPRRCILRDISFSGAKMVMMGVAKFLVNKDSALRINFDDPREGFLIQGKFVRAENVEGRKDLLALAIEFNESIVPMGYKLRLNDYLSQIHRIGDAQSSATPVPAPVPAPVDSPAPAPAAATAPAAKTAS